MIENMDPVQAPPKPKNRRFTLMMVLALLIIFGSAAVLLEYSNATTVNMTVTGSTYAYFAVVYGSTNATLPEAQNAVVELPPHANITIYAYADPSYQVVGWSVSGAQITRTGQNSISIETGSTGSTIALSVELSSGPTST